MAYVHDPQKYEKERAAAKLRGAPYAEEIELDWPSCTGAPYPRVFAGEFDATFVIYKYYRAETDERGSALIRFEHAIDVRVGLPNDEPAPASCEPLELDVVEISAQKVDPVDAVFEFDADEAAPEATSPARVVEEPEIRVAEGPVAAEAPGAPPAATDPFAAYVAAVVEVAQAAGNTRAAAALPMLLEGADFDPSVLPEEAHARLIAARVLVRSDAALSPSDGFMSMAGAWRGVLRGLTNDLSACGATTLDGWSAELLSAFGVGQGGVTDVRRELRRRGVAAFGMLLAA